MYTITSHTIPISGAIVKMLQKYDLHLIPSWLCGFRLIFHTILMVPIYISQYIWSNSGTSKLYSVHARDVIHVFPTL